MMLQTSLHNPQVPPEDKMTFKGFTSTARGINDGSDFEAKFMQDLFNSIEKSPIAMHDIEKRIKKKQ